MADYLHVNEKDKIDIKCLCGNIVFFRVLGINNATRCPKCGRTILRSSIKIKDALPVIKNVIKEKWDSIF